MNLHGFIRDLQNKVVQLYLKLEHRFSENELIRELWSGMANDVSQQIRSLNALPPSFWSQLREIRRPPAWIAAAKMLSRQHVENKKITHSIGCFAGRSFD